MVAESKERGRRGYKILDNIKNGIATMELRDWRRTEKNGELTHEDLSLGRTLFMYNVY